MPRIPLAYATADISALAKSLRDQLTKLGETPSHVQMLNILAKAAGHRNFQHFRDGIAPQPIPEDSVDERRVRRAAGFFVEGRLASWPAKTNLQALCLWALWVQIPPRQSFTEREISVLIDRWHDFGDRALLRREMVERKMMRRTPDGRDYRRIEQMPPADARAMLVLLKPDAVLTAD